MTPLIELPQLTGRTVLIDSDHVIQLQDHKHGCCVYLTDGRRVPVSVTADEVRWIIEAGPS